MGRFRGYEGVGLIHGIIELFRGGGVGWGGRAQAKGKVGLEGLQ